MNKGEEKMKKQNMEWKGGSSYRYNRDTKHNKGHNEHVYANEFEKFWWDKLLEKLDLMQFTQEEIKIWVYQ